METLMKYKWYLCSGNIHLIWTFNMCVSVCVCGLAGFWYLCVYYLSTITIIVVTTETKPTYTDILITVMVICSVSVTTISSHNTGICVCAICTFIVCYLILSMFCCWNQITVLSMMFRGSRLNSKIIMYWGAMATPCKCMCTTGHMHVQYTKPKERKFVVWATVNHVAHFSEKQDQVITCLSE